MRKFFGTDGIRGKVGAGKMTPELALKLGWAAGRVLSRSGTRKVIIGKDTRISGYLSSLLWRPDCRQQVLM